MALTTEERALLTTRLTQAEEAYHTVSMGQQTRVYVDQNGERVEYSATNAARLRAYILELRIALGLATGIQGPLKPWVL